MLDFLRVRALKGVEWVSDAYHRTLPGGWLKVSHLPEKNALRAEMPAAPTLRRKEITARLANLFDLALQPAEIVAHLGKDQVLKARIARSPGLRVPGAFDGFEMAVRAILGQQITVKAATTLGGRFMDALGEPVETPFPELNRLCPSPEKIARATTDDIARLGIISARANSIRALAAACAAGTLHLTPGADPEATIRELVKLPGIGPWTAHYIAMRALRWADAFPKEDIAVRNNLGGVTARQAEEMSRAWRPWRSYAVLHIWRH